MWIKIENYENYEVNEFGEVRNSNTGRILKHLISKKGYHRVDLCKNGEVRGFRVHRLVLMAFAPIENPEQWQVNHKDEDKSNNCLSNLEWCDAKYNNNYGTRNARIRKPINQYDEDFNLIETYESCTSAAAVTGISCGSISRAANRQKKAAGGYKWRYVEDTVDGVEPIEKD